MSVIYPKITTSFIKLASACLTIPEAPTIVGAGKRAEAVSYLKKKGYKKALIITSPSIVRYGFTDVITEGLKAQGMDYIITTEVAPDPTFAIAQSIRKKGMEAGVDCIIAIGGGSVLDCSKAIAAGAVYDGEPWDLISGKVPTRGALPIVDIITLAATGSEYDCGGVISRTETNDKVAYIDRHLFPVCSFLDPTYTFTVNAKHTAAGVADAINHVMEQYFTAPTNSVADGFCETIVKTLMKYAPKAIAVPDDYEARAEIMYACTFGCNGLLALGTGNTVWQMHGIEHALSAYYDITHGEGLAIITPHWMRYILSDRTVERFVKFGLIILGISPEEEPYEIAEKAI